MLEITVPGVEMFNQSTQEFLTRGDVVLELEHSLASLSKWESEFEKPFLGNDDKTSKEVIAYIKFMIVTPDVPEDVFVKLTEENYQEINKYIEKKMTATSFLDSGAPRTREIITAELIYYWMTVFNIPFDRETWHLNKLFTLIRVCNIKQAKPKKMSRGEIARRNREINDKRRAELGTRG